MSSQVIEIAVTGGPCSGKTKFPSYAEPEIRNHGWKMYAVEEPVTTLIREEALPIKEALATGNLHQLYECEKRITQLSLRTRVEIRLEVEMTGQRSVIVWDRAIPDNWAYMPAGAVGDKMYARILREEGYQPEEILGMYDAVIKLTTTANGAPNFYTLEDNKIRTESIKEAIALDHRIEQAYERHPRFFTIDNSTGFEEKMERALVALRLILKRQ